MENSSIQAKALAWAQAFPYVCYLDSNQYPNDNWRKYDALLAIGHKPALVFEAGQPGNAFEQLKTLHQQHDWLFGYLSYDLKNQVERLQSEHTDTIAMPELLFFVPETVLAFHAGQIQVLKGDASVIELIENYQHTPGPSSGAVDLMPRMPKVQYLAQVEKVREHIIAGDVYELNLCQAFEAFEVQLDPLRAFQNLNAISQPPFAAFARFNTQYLLCASPERFMAKRGNRLISQPIKGTRRRQADAEQDAALAWDLAHSVKDQAENVMIVDLVRNDLSRSCMPGSVQVDELFGIYPFRQVWQMISTISGTIKPDVHPVDAIKGAFPPGSMTGAPKVRAMQLIEEIENTKRGLYSGSVGYFGPDGDFDFNVVIRSILYDAEKQYICTEVGGAIVYDSEPEQEYEECMVKLDAMRKVLEEL